MANISVRGPSEKKVLTHYSCLSGPLWKQGTYTLQLLLGIPSKNKVLTYYNCCWGPLWKQITFKLQLLLGASSKAKYLHITVSVGGAIWKKSTYFWSALQYNIWVDNKFFKNK